MTRAPQPQLLQFPVAEDTLTAVLHSGAADANIGVLVIVGGPQTRVGSHRQFLLLSRALSAAGIPSFRFDFRGMGDSSGTLAPFTDSGDEIHAAIAQFMQHSPALHGVVLWGLCDGASAALLHAATHPKVRGLVLLNPWVTQAQTRAQTLVRHYYWQRIRSRDFWRKLLGGGFRFFSSLRDFTTTVQHAQQSAAIDPAAAENFVTQMCRALQATKAPVLILLSGQDLVAQEFAALGRQDAYWKSALARNGVRTVNIDEADHTFASALLRERVEQETRNFVQSLNWR